MGGLFIRAAVALTTTLALMMIATPIARADDDEKEEGRRGEGKESLQIDYRATISSEAALDTNARRQQSGGAVQADALAYVHASGRVDGRRIGRHYLALLDVGAKRFARTSAEDMLVGRLALRWARAKREGLVIGAETSYKDRLQRGDPWRDVDGDPSLACRPPVGPAATSYRCNRRDYRQGILGGWLDLRQGSWSVNGRLGASFLDYKPNRQFSYGGPDASVSLSLPLSERHGLGARAAASSRYYHPDSVTYRFVPSADGVIVQEVAEPRVEKVLSGGLSWRYRGPVLLSGALTVASSRNNGDGMDVLRGRAELNGAMAFGESTTLVASAAFQMAHYPDGNVFRRISLLADEDERQNSVALQATRRLTENLALVIKAQMFANEFSGETLPFRRQVLHGGVRWSI